MTCEHEVHEEDESTIGAGTNSSWIRCHLSDSIYIWACGEKADDDDDDLKLSDKLIGWLILFMQGFAYTMLMFLARATSESDAGSSVGDSGQSGYLLPSVTGAMYLLVASTSHDLRSGFSLLVNGECVGHRAFGIGLLIVYGIMMSAAMTVLVSTSSDSASVVLNAVTVLFVADLDEKALKCLQTIPSKWRLFWAIESIGISFALALIAITYMGDYSPLLEANREVLQSVFTTWFVWGLNPAAVTLSTVLLSSTLQTVCDLCSEAHESVEQPTFCSMVEFVSVGILAAMQRAKAHMLQEPCFNVVLVLWLADGAVCWWYARFKHRDGLIVAITLADEDGRLEAPTDISRLLCINVLLAIGLGLKACGVVLRRSTRPTFCREPSQPEDLPSQRWAWWADSRVPSLLIGWGIGYWLTSILFLFASSWGGGGWNYAPFYVTLIGYVIIPCVFVAGIFMVADMDFLVTRIGAFFKPVVTILKHKGRAEHWIMATIFRDMLVVWVMYCEIIRSALSSEY